MTLLFILALVALLGFVLAAPQRALRPLTIRWPWQIAPKAMNDFCHLPRAIATLNPVVIILMLHLVAFQWAIAWPVLIGFWLAARAVAVVWNWFLLPVLLAANARARGRWARARGNTVVGVVNGMLPAGTRTAHAINAAPAAYQQRALPAPPVHALPAAPEPQVTHVVHHQAPTPPPALDPTIGPVSDEGCPVVINGEVRFVPWDQAGLPIMTEEI